MSLKKDTFVFRYKAFELTLVEDTEEMDDVNWEAMGVPNKNKSKKSKEIPGYEGMKVQKSTLVWKLKTFNRNDIISLEEDGENTLLDLGYKKFIIEPSFVEAIKIIYNKELVQTEKTN